MGSKGTVVAAVELGLELLHLVMLDAAGLLEGERKGRGKGEEVKTQREACLAEESTPLTKGRLPNSGINKGIKPIKPVRPIIRLAWLLPR